MKRKKKSFYFKDYTETKIPEQNFNFKIAKVSYSRIVFLSFIFLTILTICSIKIFYLSLSDEKNFYSKNTQVNFSKDRRDIVDRNGNILATNVNLYDVGIRPSLLVDKEKKNLLIKLSLLVPDLEIEKIRKKLNKKSFFWLGRRLTPQERDQLWLIGNKAFEFKSRPSRIYPQQNLFSHILGQTDDINNGISGFEKSFDKDLKNDQKIKKPLYLTLDSNLQ